MSPTGDTYVANNKGPSTDPCGTPRSQGNLRDLCRPIFTNWLRSFKYDRSHASATSHIPNSDSTRCSSLLWLIVSNAADRSKLTRTAVRLLSTAWYMPSSTHNGAVSVEQPERYADCRLQKFDEVKSCVLIRANTRRSTILEIVTRFDILSLIH